MASLFVPRSSSEKKGERKTTNAYFSGISRSIKITNIATGRMLKKNISQSKKLAALKSDSARLLYTWILPHLDVEGRFSADTEIVKGNVMPKLKGWSIRKIDNYLGEMAEVGLILLYKVDSEPYLQYMNFKRFQNLRPKREAESSIPAPLLDNSSTAPDPLHPKDKIREDKISKDKISKENGGVFTPQEKTRKFFEAVKGNTQEFNDFIVALAEKNNSDSNLVEREIIKFTSYWTELSHSGRKERWQLQQTFEIMRRLATWFGKINNFSTQISRGREILNL